MEASAVRDASRERLVHDLKSVVSDIELFMAASKGEAGEAYDAALGKLKARLDSAARRIAEVQDDVVAGARDATLAADAYVHDNAWKAIAVAAGAGLLAGLLVSRR